MKYISFIRSLLLIFLTVLPLFGFAAPPDGISALRNENCEDIILDDDEIPVSGFMAVYTDPFYLELKAAIQANERSRVLELLSSNRALEANRNPSFILIASKSLIHIEMHEDVLKLLNITLQKVPDDTQLQTLKLKILYKLGRFADVIAYANENPGITNISAKKRILSSYVELKMKDKARSYALQLLADPELAKANYRLKEKVLRIIQEIFTGRDYIHLQIALYRFGFLNTKRTDYWGIRLAHTLSRLGKNQEAASVIDQLILLHPIHDPWWSQPNNHDKQRTVVIMIENGRYGEALEFTEHLDAGPDRTLFEVQILNRLGAHQQALIISQQSHIHPMMFERAIALHKLGDNMEAYQILHILLEKTLESASARQHIYRVAAFMLNVEKTDDRIRRSRHLEAALNRFDNSELDRVRNEQSKLP